MKELDDYRDTLNNFNKEKFDAFIETQKTSITSDIFFRRFIGCKIYEVRKIIKEYITLPGDTDMFHLDEMYYYNNYEQIICSNIQRNLSEIVGIWNDIPDDTIWRNVSEPQELHATIFMRLSTDTHNPYHGPLVSPTTQP